MPCQFCQIGSWPSRIGQTSQRDLNEQNVVPDRNGHIVDHYEIPSPYGPGLAEGADALSNRPRGSLQEAEFFGETLPPS